jgi:hypothetical protein
VNQIDELGKKGSNCLENLAIGSVGVLRDNHIGELGCQIDRRAFKFGGLNGSQTAISRVSDNKAAGFGIDLKDIARDIGKAIWTDDVAERYLVSWYVESVPSVPMLTLCNSLGALPSMVAADTAKGDANCVMLAILSETVLPPGIAMERACGEAALKSPFAGLKLSV